jgi:membrane protease YdiL (CAAX protease family)
MNHNANVQPSTALGVAIAVGYIVVSVALFRLVGLDYSSATALAGSSAAVLKIITALGIAGLLVTALTSVLGWQRLAWTGGPGLGGAYRAVPWLVLALLLLTADWRTIHARGPGLLLLTALATLFVGFCEELVFRGLVLAAFRRSMSEAGAWFLSTLAFGLLHLPNALLGASLAGSLVQVVLAFISGTVFYLIRRSSGGLVAPMLLHALWDFTTFSRAGGEAIGLVPLAGNGVIFAVALLAWRATFGAASAGARSA